MRIFCLFMGFLCLCTGVLAENYLLEGTIGKYPVVVNLHVDYIAKTADATYFYRSTGNDIALGGQQAGDSIILRSKGGQNTVTGVVTEELSLKQKKYDVWVGIWRNSKGRQYIVSLKKANTNISHPYSSLPVVAHFKWDNQFEYLRTARLRLAYDSGFHQAGNYKIQGYHLKNSDLEAIRVVAGTDNSTADRINNILLDDFISNFSYCKGCVSRDTGKSYGYSFNYFITGNVLSVCTSISLLCDDGMQMGYNQEVLNFDLRTGSQLQLGDVLYFPGSQADKEQYGDRLFTLLKQMYPAKMVNEDYCDYSDTAAWRQANWRITEQGLIIMPYFPRADLPCWDPGWSVIPFDTLKKYRNPNKRSLLP